FPACSCGLIVLSCRLRLSGVDNPCGKIDCDFLNRWCRWVDRLSDLRRQESCGQRYEADDQTDSGRETLLGSFRFVGHIHWHNVKVREFADRSPVSSEPRVREPGAGRQPFSPTCSESSVTTCSAPSVKRQVRSLPPLSNDQIQSGGL